jgi:Ca2+-binding RTX toxin-like protein
VEGKKDYYTHALKADYDIAIDFVGGTSSTINLESRRDLLVQGNVTVANGGSITLTSDLGSVLGTDTTAIFNDAPEVDAGLDVRLVVEGGVGELKVNAGRDIHITGVADIGTSPLATTVGQTANTSALTLDEVVSTGGNTTIVAAAGIHAADGSTLVQGHRVELSATGTTADIGGASTLRINTSINGGTSGGFAAIAGDDINVTETTGDLRLVKALQFTTTASVQGGGDVSLATASGAILDATSELAQLVGDNTLTEQQQNLIDQLNGDAPIDFVNTSVSPTTVGGEVVFDLPAGHGLTHLQQLHYRYNLASGESVGGLTVDELEENETVYYLILRPDGHASLATTLANAEAGIAISLSLDTDAIDDPLDLTDDASVTGTGHRLVGLVFDTDATNDVADGAMAFPVSPGLYSALYPLAEFLGLSPVQNVAETTNVVGQNVTLVAVNGTGSIGRSEAPAAFSLNGGFGAVSETNKRILASATASDVYGTQYAAYRFIGGASTAGNDLRHEDFGDASRWQHITYATTGASKATASTSQFVANDGYVLVEYTGGSYGLYQFNGASGNVNLRTEVFSNNVRWTRIVAERATDDVGTGDVLSGQIVLDKSVVERVGIQLQDDVDVTVEGELIANADTTVALESTDDLAIRSVRGTGDVLIKSMGDITDSGTGSFAAIGTFGDLTMASNGVIRGAAAGQDLRIAIGTNGRLFADAAGDISLRQVNGMLTVDSTSQAIGSLYVARVTTPAHADIEVTLGNMTVERVDAGQGGSLVAQGSIIDALDDAAGPIVNVDTGDLYLEATTGNIGSLSNFFDVLVGGDLSGQAGNDVFLNSPDTLNITTFTSDHGDITMTVQGEVNIGVIHAHEGTVDILADDSISDRYGDSAADIVSVSVVLESVAGTIGTLLNPLDIDTSFGGALGTVNALALGTVYLIETAGAMRIQQVKSEEDDVSLKASDGDILDADADLANNVTGVNVHLLAVNGSIGTPSDALEIDSSFFAKGLLNATATYSLNVTETAGTLYIGTVTAQQGDATLSVRDSAGGNNDFVMEAGASVSAPSTSGGNGDILIQAGDDFRQDAGASISSGRHLQVHTGVGDTGNIDHVGTTLTVEGSLSSNEIELAGERENDVITLRPTAVSGHVRMLGDADGAGGDDLLIVDHMTTLATLRNRIDDASGADVRDAVDMDGRGGTDTYLVLTHGSLATGTHDYIVNVLDTGAKNDGEDTLTIDGSADADVFLLRRVAALNEGMSAPDASNTPAFVALLHGTLDEVRDQERDDVERVNYNENINSRLIVRSFGGDDYFAVDDNATLTTLDAGAGDDQVQIGQMYGSERISLDGSVAAGDDFSTIETTAGFLSRGVTFALTGYGGTGNDQFTVYSNKAETRLEGNDGNDVFVVRAFALVGSSNGLSTEGTTQAIGGEGTDTVLYNINAPVDLDGGAGFDKVVVIGTEFGDNFVITDEGVFGAGLNVRYAGMEALDVDGMEGDDHFFVQSTKAGVITTIIGGMGADTFDVAGDVTLPIVSLDLEGRSGVVNHAVASDDGAYDNLLAPGIGLNVAGAQGGQIVVAQTDDNTKVNEQGETVDTYTIQLASAPVGGPVYINVSAARATQEEEDDAGNEGDSVLVSIDNVHFSRYLTLTVNDTAARTIYIKAVDDGRNEGERVYAISHSSQSVDAAFNHVAMKNVRVTVQDNDKPEVIVIGSGHAERVLEGDATTGITDTYSVQLGKAATGPVTVSVQTDGQVTVSSMDSRFDALTNTITFDASNWFVPVQMTITAVDDGDVENAVLSSIRHVATGYETGTFAVQVVDNDSAGLLLDESDGSTLVVADNPDTLDDEAASDTYTVRLTKAPTQDVVVTMMPDLLTTTSPLTLTFTAANWWIPQTVTVSAAEPQPPAPVQPLKTFPIQQHVVNTMAGPLFIEGFVDAAADRSIKQPIMLPDELDIPLTPVVAPVDESLMIDTLVVHNDSSVANDSGTMSAGEWFDGDVATSTNISGLGLAGDVSFGAEYFPGGKTYAGGITYRNIEVAEVLLGQGDDSFTITDTLVTTAVHGGLTVVHGGGNTSATAGDTITITHNRSPLVVYGDTAQDGARYNGESGVPASLGISFDFSGNDTIDASDSSDSITVYGGAGNDTIRGSQVGDHLFGGSGNDSIRGEGGVDHVYGDSGINVNVNTRFIAVVTVNGSALPNHDGLLAGEDTLYGNDGDDILFGDHGRIDQTAGTLRILTTGNVTTISTVVPGNGADDIIEGNQGVDRILGGNGGDTISGGTEGDIVLGDHGVIDYSTGDGNLATVDFVYTNSPDDGGGIDVVSGNEGNDLVLGGAAGDFVSGNTGNDIVLGDHGRVTYAGGSIVRVESEQNGTGGADELRGNEDDDVLIGGAYGDRIDGGSQRDLVFGDNVALDRRTGDGFANARYRILSGTQGGQIYGTAPGTAGTVLVTGTSRNIPGGAPAWEDFDIQLQNHDGATEDGGSSVFGNDFIAGGAHDDQIFGQLGNDVIQGDGSIDESAGAGRNADGTLSLDASVENLATDGDDYIEGNGGSDVIFGNLGQDDIIGGSSSLFSLTTADRRTDDAGRDLLFGGAGTDVATTDAGRLDLGDISASGHANDSDMILGDNGNIYRLVGAGGASLTFTYDQSSTYENRGAKRIVVRAADLLDYTPGGADVNAAAANGGHRRQRRGARRVR